MAETKDKIWTKNVQRVYQKFPGAIRSTKWDEIVKLANQGEFEKAEALAKAHQESSRSIRAENITSRRLRIERMALFSRLAVAEKEARSIFLRIGSKLEKRIGTIKPTVAGMERGGEIIRDLMVELRGELRSWITSLVNDALRMGLRIPGQALQPVIRANVESFQNEIVEHVLMEEALEFGLKPTLASNASAAISLSSKRWKNVIKRLRYLQLRTGFQGQKPSDIIWELTTRTEAAMKRVLVNNISAGKSSAETARKLKNFIKPGILTAAEKGEVLPRGVYKSAFKNAMRMARTETNRAFTNASSAWAEGKNWIKGMRITLSTAHSKSDICDSYAGQIVSPEEFRSLVPFHSHNVLPDQIVSAPDVIAATKAFYNGGCVEICLANGRKLSVTQGHPILTARGWVLAKDINEFDQVVIASDPERISFSINPDDKNRPSRIEDIFAALIKYPEMNTTRMPASPEDFDGDGVFIEGDIDIVRADRFLLNNVIAIASKIIGRFGFYRRDILMHILNNLSPLEFRFITNFSSSSSDIGFPGNFSPHFKGGISIKPIQSVFGMKTLGFEFGHGQRANNFFNRFKRSVKFAHRFTDRFRSAIELTNVSRIRKFNYSGHVYDLQCSNYSLFTCNDIIISNCMCYGTYVIDDKYLTGE